MKKWIDKQYVASRKYGLGLMHASGIIEDIAPYVEILGLADCVDRSGSYVYLAYHDQCRKLFHLLVPASKRLKPFEILSKLMDGGYPGQANPERRKLLLVYLGSLPSSRRFLVSPSTGWVNGCYLTATREVIGDNHNPTVIRDPDSEPRVEEHPPQGTHADWLQEVSRFASCSPLLVFAIGASLSAVLLEPLRIESGTFHIFGTSTTGKTLAAIVALSVHGLADRARLIAWDSTLTGVEELASEHCDRLLVIDDTAHLDMDPRSAAAFVRKVSFKITSGSSRVRTRHYGQNGERVKWRVLMLSTGEDCIGGLAKAAGTSRLGGDQVRMIDVPADAGHGLGIFRGLPEGQNAREFAAFLEAAARRNNGWAGPMLAREIVRDRSGIIAEARGAMSDFYEYAGVPDDPWERRFAERFALAYAAGVISLRLKILYIPEFLIRNCISSIYRAARQAADRPAEQFEKLIDTLRLRLREAQGFVVIGEDGGGGALTDRVAAPAFIRHDASKGKYYAVPLKTLARWLDDEGRARAMGDYLDKQGYLIRRSREVLTNQMLIKGVPGRPRYYCISQRFVDADPQPREV